MEKQQHRSASLKAIPSIKNVGNPSGDWARQQAIRGKLTAFSDLYMVLAPSPSGLKL